MKKEDTEKKTIGEIVRERREDLGLSIHQLAINSGVSSDTVFNLEMGITVRPRNETMKAIGTVLGLDLASKYEGPEHWYWKKREYAPRFALCRRASGRSQDDAAYTLRTSKSTLRKWETGETSPPAWTLITMARLYGVSVDYLLGYDEKPYNGRRCGLEGPCNAGKPIDFCCHDCPRRKTCSVKCQNTPQKCGQIRRLKTELLD